MLFQNFLGPSNVNQAPYLDQERLVNWYLEGGQAPGSASPWAACMTPGVTVLATDIASPGRANFYEPATERQFVVQGSRFNEVSSGGVITNRGTVAIDGNPATISSNGPIGGQLLITSGGNAYSFVLSSSTFAAIALLNGISTMGAAQDGYGLVFNVLTARTYFSSLNDFTTWDLTNFFGRSKAPDPLRAMTTANGYIYLLGAATTEVWYNAGEFPIPFVFHPSGLIQYGIAAVFSAEIAGNALWWLAETANGQGRVVRTRGFGPEVMSSYALAFALNGYSTISDAIGDTSEDRGHTFYHLTLPGANAAWCADVDLPPAVAWHERLTWISEDVRYTAWRPTFHAFAFGQHRMLDRSSGDIYVMSSDTYTDVPTAAGVARPLRRMRQTPAIFSENRRLVYPGLEVDFEVGLGLSGTGQGSDPQVMLQMSDDGGKTWGSEIWTSAGKLGEYGTRVQFNRLGSARRRVFRVVVSDPIAWKMIGAYLPDFERANPGLRVGRAA